MRGLNVAVRSKHTKISRAHTYKTRAPSNMAMMVCGIPECYRPRHHREGILHDFCSRSHAQEAADRGMIPQLRPPHGDCHVRDRDKHIQQCKSQLGANQVAGISSFVLPLKARVHTPPFCAFCSLPGVSATERERPTHARLL